MHDFIQKILEKAEHEPKRIVYPESTDERILRAVVDERNKGIAIPILIGKKEEIYAKATEIDVYIGEIEIIDPANYDKYDELASSLYEIRKHKGMTLNQAKELLQDYTYFGTMLVQIGFADGLVSGACHTTGETIKPALQIIKTRDLHHGASGLFIMVEPDGDNDRIFLFSDAAVNISPSAEDLANNAVDSYHTAKEFNLEPKIAMLSFSTKGSAKHEMIEKIHKAIEIAKKKCPDIIIDGELQIDAAIVPDVAQSKCPDSPLKGDANVLIFPDLNSANISYKLVERLGHAKAIGPILQGLKKPVNDLSRGCSVEDIIELSAVTVLQAQDMLK